jgi:hypothetical protein
MANVLTELIAMRDDRLQLSDAHFFSRDELDDFIVSLAPPKMCLPSYVQCTVP